MNVTGLVLHEVSLISQRGAHIASRSDFSHEALVFDLAKQLRSAMLDMEANAVALAQEAA